MLRIIITIQLKVVQRILYLHKNEIEMLESTHKDVILQYFLLESEIRSTMGSIYRLGQTSLPTLTEVNITQVIINDLRQLSVVNSFLILLMLRQYQIECA